MCRALKAYPIDEPRIADALRRELLRAGGQMTEQEAKAFLEGLPECQQVSVQEHVPLFSRAKTKRSLKNFFRISSIGLVTT